MSDVKWIKLSTQMFEDEKIRLIEKKPEADTVLIIWIKLLAQAGKTNAAGYVFLSENIPYSDEMLSTIFSRPIEAVKSALQILTQYKMIEISANNMILICNWEKHQNIEGLERIREKNRLRKQKERERKKSISTDQSVTRHVTHSHDLEEEKESEKNKIKIINSYSKEFEQFWLMYPRKVDKKKAYKSYGKIIKNHPIEAVLTGTRSYASQVKHTEIKYIKHPATFLNNESFLDEFDQGEINNEKNRTFTSFSEENGLDF